MRFHLHSRIVIVPISAAELLYIIVVHTSNVYLSAMRSPTMNEGAVKKILEVSVSMLAEIPLSSLTRCFYKPCSKKNCCQYLCTNINQRYKSPSGYNNACSSWYPLINIKLKKCQSSPNNSIIFCIGFDPRHKIRKVS